MQSGMTATFVDYGAEIASSRLRAAIPQRELGKLGVKKGADVLIYSKHWFPETLMGKYKYRIYDICDDHFRHPELGAYYKKHAESADVVTCNSDVMKAIVKDETGRDAVVIKEPYESQELPAEIGARLLWYGHKKNLFDLFRIEAQLKYPLLALTNKEGFPEWTPENFIEAIKKPCVVIIPTGESLAKSENRMVESIRCGKYVCAEYLPSYEPFDRFFPLGDIPAHLDMALSDIDSSLESIRAAQDYIRDRYSPPTIAKQWLEVINVNFNVR